MTSEDWKRRYLEEVSAWESAEALLRRLLGRLALAAMGDSDGMDAVLARIQEHAQDGSVEDLERDLEQVSSLLVRPETSPSSTPPALPADDDALRELLLVLIEEVSVVQPRAGSLKTLREVLDERRFDGQWRPVLARVLAELRTLIRTISSDRQALESLLQEVNAELAQIGGVLADERDALDAGVADRQSLHGVVEAGVVDIQGHIDAAADIEALKALVSQTLDGVRRGLADFMARDEARFDAARRRNEQLAERIERMERETATLQEALSESREQLLRDPLTGAHSRVAFEETMARELARFRRSGERCVLAVLDIDHFKRINDTLGHAAGDRALQLVAQVIDRRLRGTDFLFRVGGEEFVLLLPDTPAAEGGTLVEAVRTAVASSPFHFEGEPVTITVSAGVTALRDDDDATTLFERADEAMYRSKNSGRNRSTIVD
jgi:diguanylate cyclase